MRFEAERLQLRVGRFDAGGIVSAVEVSGDGKAGLSAGGADEVENLLVACKRFARPVFGDFGEEAIFDRVPFGSA